jgi:chorismate dehydratase
MDNSSLTSCAYARILFARFWKIPAEFVSHPPDLEKMLASADAALLIGDPALVALEGRDSRERRTGERLLYLDLAHEWHTLTGLSWVAAFWALRRDAIEETGVDPEALIQDLQRSRDHGLEHVEDLVAEWSARIAVPAATIRLYLMTNIHYTLDDDCWRCLEAFYRYAAECGALPSAPRLSLLRP